MPTTSQMLTLLSVPKILLDTRGRDSLATNQVISGGVAKQVRDDVMGVME
jgi:hypothetical protein